MRLYANTRTRAGLGAGAFFTMMTLAVSPSTAQSQDPNPEATPTATKASATLAVGKLDRHVVAGRRVVVRGALKPGGANRAVSLQVRTGGSWTTVDKARTTAGGRYRLAWKTSKPGRERLRLHFGGTADLASAKRTLGRTNVYRRAVASWYGPGLYGNKLACGGTLGTGTVGVAHKSMPCGTKLTLRYKGRTVRARVIDRGPYVGGREFDLTAATKRRLGFGSTGTVLSTR